MSKSSSDSKTASSLNTGVLHIVVPARLDLQQDPKLCNQVGDIIVGLKSKSIEGKLIAKSKRQNFGREPYIRCMYSSNDGGDSQQLCHGMYDVPSIINTLTQSIHDQHEKMDASEAHC